MFTITVHCVTHDSSVESVSWWPSDTGEHVFEFDNCAKGQITRAIGGCHVKVNLFSDERIDNDGVTIEAKLIATFDSEDYA